MTLAENRLGRGYIARGYNPRGVVIHNDAAGNGATREYYANWLQTHDLTLGYAHYYQTSTGLYQAADESSIAWHTANQDGNQNYIGIEACQSMGDLEQFKKNEEKSIELAAKILKKYGLPANRTTVKLHKQFSATACPHRSVELHGDWEVMQDYFIARIKAYMDGKPEDAPSKPAPSKPKTAIDSFKAYNGAFTAYKEFRVDEIKLVNGLWQMINYDLAGGKKFDWKNNGIPLDIVDNATRGNKAPTKVGDKVKFMSAYNHGTVDKYDAPSNGVGISMGRYGLIWFNADALRKL